MSSPAHETAQPIEVRINGEWREGWYRERSPRWKDCHHVFYRSPARSVTGLTIWTATVTDDEIRKRDR